MIIYIIPTIIKSTNKKYVNECLYSPAVFKVISKSPIATPKTPLIKNPIPTSVFLVL